MSATRYPAWEKFKTEFDDPPIKSKFVGLFLRSLIVLAVWHFTQSRVGILVAGFTTVVLPQLLVALIDIFLRIQFSLLAMLVSIVTLQIPLMLFFTAESGVGIGLGISLLLIWLLVFGAYIKLRLAIAKEDSAERAAFETHQDARSDAAREPV